MSSNLIELNLLDVQQLFNTMDPSPFRGKDLDRDAEEFIVGWAQEYPLNEPLTLRVHLDQWPAEDPTPLIRDAVHNYFAYRANLSVLEFKRMMRQGRVSLLIGVLFLGACLSASTLFTPDGGRLATYMRESLTIGGWVAMWRPLEIYLYDWWPVRRRGRTFARLSEMPVEVVRAARRGIDATLGSASAGQR
jgi:hypothetical protein